MALQAIAGQPTTANHSLLTIRAIDFNNFTYPWPKDLVDPTSFKRTFQLKNGELTATRTPDGMIDGMGMFLRNVVYGDVTGDGVEEAIINMSIQTGGSAIPGIVYIFSIKGNQPKLLWYFSTGDRADNGFRRAYALNGDLVLELNSPIEKKGDCCPTRFTLTRYTWQGKRFRKKQQELHLLN
ncbi:MAG: hypothetical protein J2P21_29610 [Chloracidobacterium sp.]|nr:hypothetical protein [Chloracidobacterium sp.]